MLVYNSGNITQLQKQYNMLVASLQFCSEKDKKDVFVELNKIEENILKETNEVYEVAYNNLINVETFLLEDEKKKLTQIINLILNRKEYLKKRQELHKNNSNNVIVQPNIMGEEKLYDFERRLTIINKYIKNVSLKEKLVKEIAVLEEKEKISLCRLKNNDKMNADLENKMIDVLNKAFNSLDLFSLLERVDEIELAFNELSFAKEKAKENVEIAIKSKDEITIVECNKMFESVSSEYDRYFEKKMLLELITIYDKPTLEYEELLSKREKINDILRNLSGSDLYNIVYSEIEKQYNTIKLQEQDVKNYKNISKELNEKKNAILKIDEENSSDEFKTILEELIKNEKARKERLLQEQRRKEYEERQRKLIEETKRHDEIRRKQRLIEEERKKEIERRTKELLEAKSKTVILKREDESIKKEKVLVDDERPIIQKSLPSNSIESKMKTVFVPKEVVFTNYDVFEDNTNNKKEEISKTKINEDIKEENFEIDNRNSIFESIFDEMREKIELEKNVAVANEDEKEEKNTFEEKVENDIWNENKNEFSIPVIKNSNLVATKVKEEEIEEEDLSKFKEKEEIIDDFAINDVIFPDMP